MNTDTNRQTAEGDALRILTKEQLPLGQRVRLTREVDRYPHFIAPHGMVGTVVQHGTYAVCVRMDATLDGAQEWDNEIEWFEDHLPHFVQDVEFLSSVEVTFPLEVK